MSATADLVIPAKDRETLLEIASWDGFRPASFASSDFPVDVVRLDGSASPPLIFSRGKRSETLKALPATLRQRAQEAFDRAARRYRQLSLGHGRALDLESAPLVMGVINVTPDSFSDGGIHFDRVRAAESALSMFEAGAAIVDVGGESTRPATYGAAAEISAEEEIRRVVPVIAAVREKTDRPLSIDTRKAAVAREAIAAGANLVNDVSALRYDPEMAATVARSQSGVVLMHMKGIDPRSMQSDTSYGHPIAEIACELLEAANRALQAGVDADRLCVDPGLGFGKSADGNLLLLRHLGAFRTLGFAVAVGASRKAFVRRFSGVGEDATAAERLPGSLACLAAAAAGGASLVRVHDVAESARFLTMWRAIASPAAPAESRPGAVAS